MWPGLRYKPSTFPKFLVHDYRPAGPRGSALAPARASSAYAAVAAVSGTCTRVVRRFAPEDNGGSSFSYPQFRYVPGHATAGTRLMPNLGSPGPLAGAGAS